MAAAWDLVDQNKCRSAEIPRADEDGIGTAYRIPSELSGDSGTLCTAPLRKLAEPEEPYSSSN